MVAKWEKKSWNSAGCLGCVTKVTLFSGGHQLHGANDTPWCLGAWTGSAWVAPEGSRPHQPSRSRHPLRLFVSVFSIFVKVYYKDPT